MPLLRTLIANSTTGYLGSSEKWHNREKKVSFETLWAKGQPRRQRVMLFEHGH